MSEQIKTTTVDQLPEATSLDELQVFGYSSKNAVGKRSVKVPIELLKGNKGDDGGTPIIGANGNWWINGVDTGLPARGEKGDSDLADYATKKELQDATESALFLGDHTKGGTDITSYVKSYIKSDFVISDSNGAISPSAYPPSTIQTVVMCKLEPNTSYTMKGFAFKRTDIPALSFYKTNSLGSPRSSGVKITAIGADIEFTTNSVDVYMSFTIYVGLGNSNVDFDSRNSLTVINNDASETDSIRVIQTKDGDRVLKVDNVTYYKRSIETEDISAYVKTFIQENVDIWESDGTLHPSSREELTVATVCMCKLDPNTTYRIEGLGVKKQGYYALTFYKSNNFNTPASYGIPVSLDNNTYEFTTDYSNIYVSFYIYVNVNATIDIDFDSRDTLVVKKYGASKNILVDEDDIELNVSGESSLENLEPKRQLVDIPESSFVFLDFGMDHNSGSIGKITLTGGALGIYNLPLEEGFLYEIEYNAPIVAGTVNKGTVWAVTHDRAGLGIEATHSFPVYPKNTVLASGAIKYLTLQVDIPGWGIHARDTIKIYKVNYRSIGFSSTSGFIDLKTLGGVTNYSNFLKPQIPFPSTLASYHEFGNNNGMTSDNRKKKEFKLYIPSCGAYFEGMSETAFQGATTLGFSFKNTKNKLYNFNGNSMDIRFGSTIRTNNFHLKATYTDLCNARNVGGYRLAIKMHETLPVNRRYPWNKAWTLEKKSIESSYDNGAKGVPNGFPCVFYDNGSFMGLKSFMHRIDRNNYRMKKSNPNHLLYRARAQVQFKIADKNQWEELNRDNEGANMPDQDFVMMTNFTEWLNTTTNFREEAPSHINIISAIQQYLHTYYVFGIDNWGGNLVIAFYEENGLANFFPWDLDRTFGSNMDKYLDPKYDFHNIPNSWDGYAAPHNSKLWGQLQQHFMPEIKAEYKRLKNIGLFTPDGIKSIFREIEMAQNIDVISDTADLYPMIFGVNSWDMSFQQIYDWIDGRAIFMDNKFGG